ncbi:hypothetical protein JQX13_24840 [Archangium violaceum]|uniref:hypothetical protein n=1 Tax=Archangium violaceum TaxID=83451 RepID=UPI00193BE837|nr:hypothetical protein [Archangium violaceum]QRK12974.1 hypothetical protein JQX13_24840 [Archangium violaceum]
MTWILQAAVVLAVPLTLLGAVKTGVHLLRKARKDRTGSVATAIELQFSSMPGIRHFKDWLADLVDGTSDSGDSVSGDAGAGGGADASDAGVD